MNNIYETIELENVTVTIYLDDCNESPREWDNLGTMVCWHRRYTLGDKHDHKNPGRFLVELVSEHLSESDYDYAYEATYEDDYLTKTFKEKLWKLIMQHHFILPLYLYDHSGITMNTSGFSCRWDSGQVGWIYVSHEQAKKEYGWKYITASRAGKIKKHLQLEVETYDQYLTGDIYSFTTTCKACGEEIDSCSGFYGTNWKENGLLECAEDSECSNCASVAQAFTRINNLLCVA